MTEPKRLIEETDSPLERAVLQAGGYSRGGDRLRFKVLVALGVATAVSSTSKTSLAMMASWKQAIVVGALGCAGVAGVIGYQQFASEPESPESTVHVAQVGSPGRPSKDLNGRPSKDTVQQGQVDRAGVDRAGVDRAGVDRAGVDQAGVDQAGADQDEAAAVESSNASASKGASPANIGADVAGGRDEGKAHQPRQAGEPVNPRQTQPNEVSGLVPGPGVSTRSPSGTGSAGSMSAGAGASRFGASAKSSSRAEGPRKAESGILGGPAAAGSQELPPPVESAPLPSSLEQEVAVLDAARSALAAGRWGDALRHLSDHSTRFPRGSLLLEAEVLRIEALASSGNADEASRRAQAILRRSPNSIVAKRLRRFIRE
jgi:hypothetical protein